MRSDPILDDAELENDLMEPESDSIGQTSEEASENGEDKKREFSVYDAMLLVSLICVALATLLLVLELRRFGNFPFSFPWRTTEVLNLLWF
jgi:hypothetical protein